MHSSDQDSALIAHDRSESFRPPHHRLGGAPGCGQNWVLLLNGRGKNDQLGVLCVLWAMVMEKFQTESLQAFDLERDRLVRAADAMAKFKQKRCNPAHPAAGHSDQVNAVMLACEKSRQIKISQWRHVAVYRSIVSTTAFAALCDESRAEFFDIRSKRTGSSIISRILCARTSSRISASFTTIAASALVKISALRVW